MEEQATYFAGVDWAMENHDICVVDVTGKVLEERQVTHTPQGLHELCQWLASFNDGVDGIDVSIEIPHGPVVETLLEYGVSVFAINPKQLDRFRDRFTVAGAKDDRRDARVLADSPPLRHPSNL